MRGLVPYLLFAALPMLAQSQSSQSESVTPEVAAVEKAAQTDAAKADTRARARIREVLSGPDFTAEETIRIPKLKNRPEEKSDSEWIKRIEKFFRWLAEVLRSGVWVLAGIGLLVLLFTLHYWWRISSQKVRSAEVSIPTHVGGLDIRPESLPDDVGAAALMRWQAGDAVGCLSLLYRGALSVLVGRYGADIRSSSTESECVRAARSCLDATAQQYFVELTNVWQLTVYAARQPGDEAMRRLCAEFSMHFAPPAFADGAMMADESARVTT